MDKRSRVSPMVQALTATSRWIQIVKLWKIMVTGWCASQHSKGKSCKEQVTPVSFAETRIALRQKFLGDTSTSITSTHLSWHQGHGAGVSLRSQPSMTPVCMYRGEKRKKKANLCCAPLLIFCSWSTHMLVLALLCAGSSIAVVQNNEGRAHFPEQCLYQHFQACLIASRTSQETQQGDKRWMHFPSNVSCFRGGHQRRLGKQWFPGNASVQALTWNRGLCKYT